MAAAYASLSVTGTIDVADLIEKSLSPYTASYSIETEEDGLVVITQYIRGFDIFGELDAYAVIQSYLIFGNVEHRIEPVRI